MTDGSGKIIYVNDHALQALKVSREVTWDQQILKLEGLYRSVVDGTI